MRFPPIIQGGMGVAVSRWPLAHAVAVRGQIGVVSGTALDVVLARNLQDGDPCGSLRRAMSHFPIPGIAERVLDRYFVPGGRKKCEPYRSVPVHSAQSPKALVELTVLANYVEVFLAKEGHSGQIGINYLEKIQLPTLPSLLGAMLAGVHFVFMGAGIPRAIPGIMDDLAQGRAVEMQLDVEGAGAQTFFSRLDPSDLFGGPMPEVARPAFVAIISSTALAQTLARKASGRVDGFVIEGATAGGHNAPPRGAMQLDATGQPIYGPRDLPDLGQIRSLGIPFWLAGSYGRPNGLQQAQAEGAEGIQVGTAFAFCDESNMRADLKARALALARVGRLSVFTDPLASPTGFPFKVLQLDGTVSDPTVYGARERVCDVGFLRHTYLREDGKLGYRCPAEPIEQFVAKGGTVEETVGRKCVCNGLSATVDLAQIRSSGYTEEAILTAGDDAADVAQFLKPGATSYSADDVVDYLLCGKAEPAGQVA